MIQRDGRLAMIVGEVGSLLLRASLIAVLLIVVVVSTARAIEDLEAEEDIAELLPNKFPMPRAPRSPESRSWAILPQVGFGPDTGALGGVVFADRDLFGSGTSVDFNGVYALREQQAYAFSIASPNLFNGRVLALFRARYTFDPQRQFFGLGNNDFQDPVSTHLFQEEAGALTVGWRPFERVAFNFSIGYRQVQIRRGKKKDDLPFTPDDPDYMDLPGIHGGKINPIALSLVWNDRDDVMRPTRGWRVILKVVHTNKALLSDFDYTRYILDAGYLRYLLHERRIVLGLRVNGEWIDASVNRIPFWDLPELGGEDTLRGFFPHRFIGRGRLLMNGEARFKIVDFRFFDLWKVHLDGVLFGDGGRVFIDRADLENEFRLNTDIVDRIVSNFQYDYGAGLRITLSEALVARIDVGFSDEETGLVYLTFGQTF